MAIFKRSRKESATSSTTTQDLQLNSNQIESSLSTVQSTGVHYAVIPGNDLASWQQQETPPNTVDPELFNLISHQFDEVLTLIDDESFSGNEGELSISQSLSSTQEQQRSFAESSRGLSERKKKGSANNSISPFNSANYFSKVNFYANSRLPIDLPPMRLYIPTFPLLGLAARYSADVYAKPSSQETETHIESNAKMGTKAMVIKSVPMDDVNTIVFAIRGTQNFTDMAVNLKTAPASPENFLDDPGNLCHAGFLNVARKMITPVAARLRHLLEEEPNRSRYSLLITGHSAGGAVAALLYCHMLSTSQAAQSELNVLTGFFKRVHCVTFGAPPISLLPLMKPSTPALRKSIFLSFVNEGDPIPRAEKAYVRSLLSLYCSPVPGETYPESASKQSLQRDTLPHSKSSMALTLTKSRPRLQQQSKSDTTPAAASTWPVPEAAMSNAGRIVLLRSLDPVNSRTSRKQYVQERMDEGIVAQMVSDELLRGVIWGDPSSIGEITFDQVVEIFGLKESVQLWEPRGEVYETPPTLTFNLAKLKKALHNQSSEAYSRIAIEYLIVACIAKHKDLLSKQSELPTNEPTRPIKLFPGMALVAQVKRGGRKWHISGIADWAVGYGGRGVFQEDTVLLAVEAKRQKVFFDTEAQLLAYLAIIRQLRIQHNACYLMMQGFYSDGEKFRFLRICHDGTVMKSGSSQHPLPEIDYYIDADGEVSVKVLKDIGVDDISRLSTYYDEIEEDELPDIIIEEESVVKWD